MVFLRRVKRVTDPLDDRVKDRIVGREPVYVSSGSVQCIHDNDSSFSCHCLSYLNHCFLQQGDSDPDDKVCQVTCKKCDTDSDLGSDPDSTSHHTDESIEKVKSILRNQNDDAFRNVLLGNVVKGVEVFNSIQSNKQMLHRNVMFFLKKSGYNAAICKTRWHKCNGITEGNHEFMDVVCTDSGTRYFIDLNFADEFGIARETNQFRGMYDYLPTVFVGKPEDLKQIVKLISDGARLSLKTRGLLLPPWRKNRYMQNKWFGPYRRTINYTPTNKDVISTSNVVKCSYVGFIIVDTPVSSRNNM